MNLTGKPILELAEGSEADEAEEADDDVRGADAEQRELSARLA